MTTFKIFRLSAATSVAALAVAFIYGMFMRGTISAGAAMLWVCFVVGVLEVSMSFDNAAMNAIIITRMSDVWQRRFLIFGVPIATFGMRFTLPLGIVWATAGLTPYEAMRRALNPPAHHAAYYPNGLPSYETCLHLAEYLILGFGGMFLLPLFLTWLYEQRDTTWLSWIERPLAVVGRLDSIAVATSLAVFLGIVTALLQTHRLHSDQLGPVLIAGMIGLALFLIVGALDKVLEVEEDETPATDVAASVVRGGLMTFIYLELLDASFSFDGVVGSFAITSDPIIIALGTGLIGSMFVRSLTIYLVKRGALKEFAYLEHGAHWAIGTLSIIMLVGIGVHVPDVVTASVGVVIIVSAVLTSVVQKRRHPDEEDDPASVYELSTAANAS